MVDALSHGRRPVAAQDVSDDEQRKALASCPGISMGHGAPLNEEMARAGPEWGPVLSVFEGHAGDQEIRHAGSSGGATTALGLHAVEALGFAGVMHTAARRDQPLLNETVISRTRAELLSRTGSRYAPASPCDRLHELRHATGQFVFVGKPCDIAGLARLTAVEPWLAERIGLTIAFFCAGTPTTAGTLALLHRMGIADPQSVVSLRYRGNGWPGRAVAEFRTPSGNLETRSLTYGESWGDVLSHHKQWRCNVCLDHTGEFADIAVGDPWDVPTSSDDPGRSLVVARTDRGLRFVRSAAAARALVLDPAEAGRIATAQPNLLRGRGRVWGTLLALRLCGLPRPHYRHLPAFAQWRSQLTLGEKMRSLVGTVARIGRRGLRRSIVLDPINVAPNDCSAATSAPGTRLQRVESVHP